MGNLFGGSTKTTSSNTSTTSLNSTQQGYLDNIFSDAANNYANTTSTPYYTGETYAGMTDQQKSDLAASSANAQNSVSTGNALSSLGTGLLGNYQNTQDAISAYQSAANGNTTQANINAAAQYADNPYLSAQIDAANRDVSRTLNEQTLPTIDRNASAAGGLNSSRAGVAAGIAQRGAADQMADTAATLRGNAYSQGLTLAQQDNTNKLNALNNIIGDYSGLASQGLTALNDGTTLSNNAYNTINSNNSALQADQQGKDTAAFNQWQGQDTRDTQALQNLYNIIGANNWGSTTTSTGTGTTSQSGGVLSGLLGAATGGLGIASGLGWKPLS